MGITGSGTSLKSKLIMKMLIVKFLIAKATQ